MPTHMQMHLCTCTQTEHDDTKHYLSGSHQIPSTSDHHPPLSAHHFSPTTPHAAPSTPHHKPCIRTLAKELGEEDFRTPNGPGGSGPDPEGPNNPDDDNSDNNDDLPDPDIEDNPLLTLVTTITHLSHATRHRNEDSGSAQTKVCEPNTFDSMDLKKLHEFLIQCKLNFHDRPQAFCSDVQKVGFALSFLKGITLTWFEPNLFNAIPGDEPA
ncbi:hypothetical protein ID866_11319 [Astraeus odoratus]|nr:hypothetical protein ID866_11319 [Astraeus odoratus]